MNLSAFIKVLKNSSPPHLRKTIKNISKKFRRGRNYFFYILGRKIDKNEVKNSIKNLGIKKGDIVFVHSSLSRLGIVDGGADTILQSLFDVVGKEGTIGSPTFWGLTKDYLAGKTTYDVKQSQSYLGALTEKIRKHPDAKRSLHPTHSVAFIGPMADFLVKDHHHDKTPFGPNSPYHKMIQKGGKILLLGVDVEYMTSLHTIEDSIDNFPVQVYKNKPITFNVIDTNNESYQISSYIHCPETAKFRNSFKLIPYFHKYKIIQKTKIGFGTAKIIRADRLHKTLIKLYHNGITMYK